MLQMHPQLSNIIIRPSAAFTPLHRPNQRLRVNLFGVFRVITLKRAKAHAPVAQPLTKHRENPSRWPPAQSGENSYALANFFRRYSDGRQPIHFVNALEKTNGFW
jgi:hypothetical protein